MVTTSFKTGYFFHNETNNLCLKNQNQHQFVRGYSYPLEAGYIHKNGNKKFSVFYKMDSQNIRGSEQLHKFKEIVFGESEHIISNIKQNYESAAQEFLQQVKDNYKLSNQRIECRNEAFNKLLNKNRIYYTSSNSNTEIDLISFSDTFYVGIVTDKSIIKHTKKEMLQIEVYQWEFCDFQTLIERLTVEKIFL